MIIVELFDANALDNVAAQYFYPQAQLLFFGDPQVMTEERMHNVRQLCLAIRAPQLPEFHFIPSYTDHTGADRLVNINYIIESMEDVVHSHPDQDFYVDITGGTETELVCMGMLAGRQNLPVFRLDIGACRPLVLAGSLPQPTAAPLMRVRDMATLYGGSFLYSEDERRPLTRADRAMVVALWKNCRRRPGYLGQVARCANSLAAGTRDLHVVAHRSPESWESVILQDMLGLGLIRDLKFALQGLRYDYVSDFAKALMTRAGLALELFTYMAAQEAGIYEDCHQSVNLDWAEDAVPSGRKPDDTRNEVDVILMRGLTPVFISCKSGDVKKEALYELDVVARHFGGKYAVKVLACNRLSGLRAAEASLRSRAQEMGITIIDKVNEMSLQDYAQVLARL